MATRSHRLTDEGYRISQAASGCEAVRVVVSSPLDLIVLDPRMPGMNGLDVIRTLKSDPTTEVIPIIVLPAGRTMLAEARQLPVAAVLEKPFQVDDLLAQVQAALNQSGPVAG